MITFPITLTQILSPDEPVRRAGRRRVATAFTACWKAPVLLHWRVPVAVLQEHVPYPLDIRDDSAWVSVAAYSLNELVWRDCPWLPRLASSSPYRLLNVQTCVRVNGRPGIYLLRGWCQGGLTGLFGPRWFDLPCRRAKITYQPTETGWEGSVRHPRWGAFHLTTALLENTPRPALSDSLDEFLLERYLTFTFREGRAGWFRLQHHPWQYRPLLVDLKSVDLLRRTESWFGYASFSHAVQAETLWDARFSRWKRLSIQENPGSQ